jgi:methionyl-tRNA formyltransferase
MTICIAGKNRFALDALEYVRNKVANCKIIACVNKTDKGTDIWQPSFKKYCCKNSIDIVELEDCYEIRDLYFFSLEYDRLLIPQRFSTLHLFNIHFSRLPEYKGMYTSLFPLMHGRSKSGVTLHLIDKGIDTGQIIDQIEFEISETDTCRDLYLKYIKFGTVLFKNNFDSIFTGQYTSFKQPINGSSYFSKKSINFSNLFIDLNKTAWEVHNNIRCFIFREYQLPVLFSSAICKSQPLYEITNGKPGTIDIENKYFIILNTVDYKVKLWKDQLAVALSAAEHNKIEELVLLKQNNYDLFEKNDKGWDALIVAAFHEQFTVVKFLIDINLDINTTNNNGTTLLMYSMTAASKSGRIDILNYLIDNGADLYRKDNNGYDILYYANKLNNTKVITYLNEKYGSSVS